MKVPASFDHARKYDIIGILMMVFSLLVLLAFVSHTPLDEAVADLSLGEFFGLFTGNPEIQARADTTSNWLGLFGAMMAKFFINSMFGYFSIVFPILLGLWGWFIVARRNQLRVIAYYSNYAIIGVTLLSTMAGLLRSLDWLFTISYYWSGAIGEYLAAVLGRIIGTSGGIIVVLALLIIVSVVVIDVDVRKAAARMSGLFAKLRQVSAERKQKKAEAAEANAGITVSSDEMDNESEPALPVEPPNRARDMRARDMRPRTRPLEPALPRVEKKAPEAAPLPETEFIVTNEEWESPRLKPAVHSMVTDVPRSNGSLPKEAIPGLAAILDDQGASLYTETHKDLKPTSPRNSTNGRTAAVPPKTMTVTDDVESGEPELQSIEQDEVSELVDPYKLDELLERQEAAETSQFAGARDAQAARAAVSVAPRQTEIDGDDYEQVNAELASARLPYQRPTLELLDIQERTTSVSEEELRTKGELLKEKLAVFGIGITKISVTPGPVVTMFELVPDSSVKISKIVALSDDLALALAARGIRIIAPIPGKGAVGIEIPNNEPEMVHFRAVVGSANYKNTKAHLPLAMGKSITGEVYCTDLAKMPHLLIAGATGAGKSVGVNTMINSLLYTLHPSDVKLVLIDPKKIELAQYQGLENHFLAKCPDINEVIITDPGNAVIALKSLEVEMDNRYTKLAKAGVRHVSDYNEKVKARLLKDTDTIKHYKLPYIVVVIDELADLMITASREVEEPIARLAQLARAVGIHLIVATQRPSVDVLTGVIKANFPARIAYKVASRVDSRTIMDGPGADRLLGNGDMLYQPTGYPKPIRIQNAFLSTEEVERVVEFIASQRGYMRPYLLPSLNGKKKGKAAERDDDADELLLDAARLIVRHQQGSVSLLQRRLKIGYSRAARIVDQLELAGIVGPSDGSKAREVLVDDELMVEQYLEV